MPRFNQSDTNTNDFLSDVSKGAVVGLSPVIIEGMNPDLDMAAEEDLWNEGGLLSYLSSAETMNVTSTSTDDDVGGTGVTAVFITGLDANNLTVSEVVTMDGTSNVLTVNAYTRISFVFASAAGSGLTNAGNITLTASSAATVQANMLAGTSSGLGGFYTIPSGKRAIIRQVEMDATKLSGGGTPLVNFRMYARFSGANQPWVVILERRLDTAVQDQLIIPFPLSNILVSGADLRLACSTDTNNTEARMRITLLEYDA